MSDEAEALVSCMQKQGFKSALAKFARRSEAGESANGKNTGTAKLKRRAQARRGPPAS
jgi:hypothetical protein